MISERPHPAPCACPVCQTWAKELVGAPGIRRPSAAVRDISLAEFAREMIALACKATGLSEAELQAHAEYIGEELLDARKTEMAERATLVSRGVPEIHIRAVYDSQPIDCEALIAVRDFLQDGKSMLVLAGGVGLRKTGSACWALTRKPGRFVTADDILRLSGSRADDEKDLWRRVRNAQLLVIDDIGGEYSDDKGWSVKVINALLDHRYSGALKTVITTNLPAKQFAAEYGQRIVDRIHESGRFITLVGTSVRRVSA